MRVPSISVEQLAGRLDGSGGKLVVLDVREGWEREIAVLPGTAHVPMEQVPERLDELRELQGGAELIVHCHSGKRSALIVRLLQQNGFDRVFNLDGGIEAWALALDPAMKRY